MLFIDLRWLELAQKIHVTLINYVMLIALKLKGEADAAPLDGSACLTGG